MKRKRAIPQQISDDRKRNLVFSKRAEGLAKKANDLSILCGVDAGMVVHKPAQNNAVLWPSPQIYKERMEKFLDFSETERGKKMIFHDEYMEERLKDETDDVDRSRKRMSRIVSEQLMNEMLAQDKTFQEVDLGQLDHLQSFMDEMLIKLYKRDDEIDSQ